MRTATGILPTANKAGKRDRELPFENKVVGGGFSEPSEQDGKEVTVSSRGCAARGSEVGSTWRGEPRSFARREQV